MKKFLFILLVLIVVAIASLSYFASTNYFFNNYIASNIKKYGFDYSYAKGALFKGFVVEGLSYKNKPLSSDVIFRINPLKLLYGVVSISKINLIGVRENTLEHVINDFHPSSDSQEASNIGVNFELKNILLTVKPFKIKEINVNKNNLMVSYVSFLNGNFNIGKVNYSADTNLGEIHFDGKYEHRILYIDKLDLNKLKILEIANIVKGIKTNKNQSEYHLESNPFIPKIVEIKHAKAKLEPFEFEGIKSKKILLHFRDSKFNISKLLLQKAHLAVNYNGNIISLITELSYDNRLLNIDTFNLKVNNLDKLLKIINVNARDNKQSNIANVKIIPINRLKVVKSSIELKSTRIKNEKINKLLIGINSLDFDANSGIITHLDNYQLSLDSSLAKLNLKGSVNKSNHLKFVNIITKDTDRLIEYIKSFKDNETNNTKEAKDKKILPLFRQDIVVDKIDANIDNLSFLPYKITKGAAKAKSLVFDSRNMIIKSGKVFLDTDSNWGRVQLRGYIKNNNYFAKGFCNPNQKLLDTYSIPLKAKKITSVEVSSSRFGFKSFDINATLKGQDVLKNFAGLNIVESTNSVKYIYGNSYVHWGIKAKVDTPFLKSANLINDLFYKNHHLNYFGSLKSQNVSFLDKKYSKLFENISATYSGDSKKLLIDILSNDLKANVVIDKYKNAMVSIKNKNIFALKDLIPTLSQNYNSAKIDAVDMTFPINFLHPFPLKGKLKIISNLVNLKGLWSIKNSTFGLQGDLSLPYHSILFNNLAMVNKKILDKMKLVMKYNQNNLSLKLQNSTIKSNILYNINTGNLDNSTIATKGLVAQLDGNLKLIHLKAKTDSIKSAQYSIGKLLNIKQKNLVDGKLLLEGEISNLSKINFLIKSSKINYYSDQKTKTKFENILLQGVLENSKLKLSQYRFKVNDYSIYSHKSSLLNLKKLPNIKIDSLWINENLLLTGNYNLLNSAAKLKLKSNNFKLENSDIALHVSVNSDVLINKEKITANGKVVVLDGIVKRVLGAKNIAENSDIIILQRQQSRHNTNFAKNIKLDIKVDSTKGILYEHSGNKIRIIPKLKIVKQFNRLSNIKGKAVILKNSYYFLNGKRLFVQNGEVIFSGKSMTPNLNIKLIYRGQEYKIKINVVGTPTRPVLYFTSDPALNKDQILAYLLFDDASAAGTHDQSAMLNTIGGSIAKSFLGSLGIKLDHISIKEHGFSIGKSLGKHVILYYNQENQEPSVKVRVNISQSIHSDIQVGQDKQSADIIFSRDY